jgi:hypothetical protein
MIWALRRNPIDLSKSAVEFPCTAKTRKFSPWTADSLCTEMTSKIFFSQIFFSIGALLRQTHASFGEETYSTQASDKTFTESKFFLALRDGRQFLQREACRGKVPLS